MRDIGKRDVPLKSLGTSLNSTTGIAVGEKVHRREKRELVSVQQVVSKLVVIAVVSEHGQVGGFAEGLSFECVEG
jgi:hypothetical protein